MAHTQSLPQRGDAASRFTVLMLWVLLAVFVVYPLVRLLAMAFTADGSFTLENLRPFVESWYDRQAAVNSILLGCSVGVAGTVLGFIFAFAVTRLSLPKWLCAAVSAVTLLPLISPPFTSSIALTLSLGPNGILLDFFGLGNFNFYGFWGTFISETLTFFPVAFMTLSTILARIDPNLEDAAYSLGASSFKVFRTVTLPLAPQALDTLTLEDVVDHYKQFYAGRAFVRVLDAGQQPKTASVVGTNAAQIGLALNKRAGVLVATGAIDNLCKGAAGQAVQCANIVFGFDERRGLPTVACPV